MPKIMASTEPWTYYSHVPHDVSANNKIAYMTVMPEDDNGAPKFLLPSDVTAVVQRSATH